MYGIGAARKIGKLEDENYMARMRLQQRRKGRNEDIATLIENSRATQQSATELAVPNDWVPIARSCPPIVLPHQGKGGIV
jgi:hypothetical protein